MIWDPGLRDDWSVRDAPQSLHGDSPPGAATCSVCKGIFGVNVYPACRRFPSGRAKLIGSFHSDGLIGRDARTTSAPGRACSAALVDSGARPTPPRELASAPPETL